MQIPQGMRVKQAMSDWLRPPASTELSHAHTIIQYLWVIATAFTQQIDGAFYLVE
jgi:hypothetical protein